LFEECKGYAKKCSAGGLAAGGACPEEDLTYSHSNARLQTKADVVKATLGATTIEAMDFSEVTVRVYGTTALIRANVDMRNSTSGKSTTSHINCLFVWLKGPGGWQLVGRQATQVSPPTTP